MNKRGWRIIIIVLFVLIIGGIFWYIFSKISEKKPEIITEQSLVNITIDPSSVMVFSYDGTANVSLKLKMNLGEGEIDSLKFIISDGNFSHEEIVNTTLEELNKKTYSVSIGNLNASSLQTITVVPIFKGEEGEKKVAVFGEEYNFQTKKTKNVGGKGGGGGGGSGGGGGGILTCTSKTCADYFGQCGNQISDGCGGILNCNSNCLEGFYCYNQDGIASVCVNNSITCSAPNNLCVNSTALTQFYCYYNGTDFKIKNITGICSDGCSNSSCSGRCDLISALWNVTSAAKGELVELNFHGDNCVGKELKYVIYKDILLWFDEKIITSSSSKFTTWKAGLKSDRTNSVGKYYFKIFVVGNEDENIQSDNFLEVSETIVKICTSGEKKCSGNLFQTCNSEGTEWILTDTCSATENCAPTNGCVPKSSEICNGIDDNGNNLIDENEGDCAGATPYCISGICKQCRDNSNCDDNLYCNGVETCDALTGCKSGTLQVCNDGISCTADSCNEQFDRCDYNTASCTCATNSQCNDNNPCTDDICTSQLICAHTNNNANICSDNKFCTTNDRCSAGNCIADVKSVDDNIACTTDSCDEVSDLIKHIADNSKCNDNLFCNGVETCDAVTGCKAGTPITCSDGVSCTADSCNEATDSCLFNTASCTCATNSQCNDNNPCTDDICTSQLICSNINKASGTTCDDGKYCTINDKCNAGTCVADIKPVNDNIVCTIDSCDETSDKITHTPDNSKCNDNLFCNGVETCSAMLGCQKGIAPSVDDKIICTIDSCDETSDRIIHAPIDSDGDGYNICDGANKDCNDNDRNIKPGAVEICDGVDNNCNGQIDEGVKNILYKDNDRDGYGNLTNSTYACSLPGGYASNSLDCNDNNKNINPAATEICGNKIDDNCNNIIDGINEGCVVGKAELNINMLKQNKQNILISWEIKSGQNSISSYKLFANDLDVSAISKTQNFYNFNLAGKKEGWYKFKIVAYDSSRNIIGSTSDEEIYVFFPRAPLVNNYDVKWEVGIPGVHYPDPNLHPESKLKIIRDLEPSFCKSLSDTDCDGFSRGANSDSYRIISVPSSGESRLSLYNAESGMLKQINMMYRYDDFKPLENEKEWYRMIINGFIDSAKIGENSVGDYYIKVSICPECYSSSIDQMKWVHRFAEAIEIGSNENPNALKKYRWTLYSILEMSVNTLELDYKSGGWLVNDLGKKNYFLSFGGTEPYGLLNNGNIYPIEKPEVALGKYLDTLRKLNYISTYLSDSTKFDIGIINSTMLNHRIEKIISSGILTLGGKSSSQTLTISDFYNSNNGYGYYGWNIKDDKPVEISRTTSFTKACGGYGGDWDGTLSSTDIGQVKQMYILLYGNYPEGDWFAQQPKIINGYGYKNCNTLSCISDLKIIQEQFGKWVSGCCKNYKENVVGEEYVNYCDTPFAPDAMDNNLLDNAGFEDAKNIAWEFHGNSLPSIQASDFNGASKSLRITGFGFALQKPSALLNSQNKKFRITFWAKHDLNNKGSVSIREADWGKNVDSIYLDSAATGWKKYSKDFTLPLAEQYMVILDSSSTNAGNVWYDNISLIEIFDSCSWPPESGGVKMADSNNLMNWYGTIENKILCYDGRWQVTSARDRGDISQHKQSAINPKGYVVRLEGEIIGSWIVKNGIWVQDNSSKPKSLPSPSGNFEGDDKETNEFDEQESKIQFSPYEKNSIKKLFYFLIFIVSIFAVILLAIVWKMTGLKRREKIKNEI